MRIRDPRTTALIFASGKMVVTGAKSEDDSRLASRKYARIIQKLGFEAKFAEFKIQNMVGSCDVKFPIRLEGLAFSHGAFSSYEPEVNPSHNCLNCFLTYFQLFPGLIYRMLKPKVVILIFVSGKIVLTGAKVREEIYMAFNQIYSVLLGKLTFPSYVKAYANIFLCRIPKDDIKSRLTGFSFITILCTATCTAPTSLSITFGFQVNLFFFGRRTHPGHPDIVYHISHITYFTKKKQLSILVTTTLTVPSDYTQFYRLACNSVSKL